MTDPRAEAFIEAVHELVLACHGMGLKPPTSINFHTAKTRNYVADAAVELKHVGNPMAEKYVTVTPEGKVEIEGVGLHVRW